MLNKICIFFAFVGLVNSQSCGIVGEADYATITLPAVKESATATGDLVLASLQVYNVMLTSTVPSPHDEYVTNSRNVTSFYLLAKNDFPYFVQRERSQLLRHEIRFTCTDQGSVRYTLLLPVEDENTQSPGFNEPEFHVTVQASSSGTLLRNISIFASDEDVDKKNADLLIRSSNPWVIPVRVQMDSDIEFVYRVDLMVAPDAPAGDYRVILTADDYKYAVSSVLFLTVVEIDEEV